MQFKARTRSQQSYDLNLLYGIIKFYRLFCEYCSNAKFVVDHAVKNYQTLSNEELVNVEEERRSLQALTNAANTLLAEDVFIKVNDTRIRKFHCVLFNSIASANHILNFYLAIQENNQIETYEKFVPVIRMLNAQLYVLKEFVNNLRDVVLQELKAESENNESQSNQIDDDNR